MKNLSVLCSLTSFFSYCCCCLIFCNIYAHIVNKESSKTKKPKLNLTVSMQLGNTALKTGTMGGNFRFEVF